MNNQFKDVFMVLFPFLRPHILGFTLAILFILSSTGIEVALPWLMGWIVEEAVPGKSNLSQLKIYCSFFLGMIVSKYIIDTVQAYVIQRVGQGISHELRCAVFEKISSLEVSYFDRNPTGRLLTRVINDIKALSELFTASISVLALDILVILGTIIAMVMLNWRLGTIVLISFPLVIWTILFFGKRQASTYRKVRKLLSEINAFLGENIAGIPTIQRLNAERSRAGSFSKITGKHLEAQTQSLKLFALVQPFANVLNGIAMASVIGVGGFFVYRGEIRLGIIISYLGYLRNLFQPVRDLVEKYNTFLAAYVSAERVVTILKEESESARDVPDSRRVLQKLSIRFRGVSFQYANRFANAIQDVTFDVEEGRSLAIVGATGSGKSTIVRLLMRFYRPDRGSIQIGEREISDWNRQELRRYIGMIHQDVYLMAGTLRENLTVGRAKVTDADLIECCKNVQLWDFISNRGGLDFQIFEGGSNLSVGEKQLINFARMLVLDPRILIFDEATSNIDKILEGKILKAVSKVLSGRTTIAIAHRLSTIQSCDQILVMGEGQVLERGSFSELKASHGTFKMLWESYSNV